MSSLYTNERMSRGVDAGGALGVVLALVIVFFSPSASAQADAVPPALSAATVEEAVGGLVADALAANLELDSAGAQAAQRLAALDQARALYLPSLDLDARYTRANGGRTIDFPVGD